MTIFTPIRLDRALPVEQRLDGHQDERLSPRSALLIWVLGSLGLWAVLLGAGTAVWALI